MQNFFQSILSKCGFVIVRKPWLNPITTAPVQLHDLVLIGAKFYEKPEQLMSGYKNTEVNPKLRESTFFPFFYDSNPKTLTLLGLLVEQVQPKVIVETGIANGTSTRVFLSSLSQNDLQNSILYSVDIDPRVVTSDLIDNSQFKFLLLGKDGLSKALDEISNIDLFYHDSDHSYENQMMEYELAWKKLTPGGVLVSDDINWSNAFLDFCKKIRVVPVILADTEKFCGVIFKNS
jgi:predicted O-methyltransferase YrrM